MIRMTLSKLIEKVSLADAKMVTACVQVNVDVFLVDDDFTVMAAGTSARMLAKDSCYTLVEVVPG